MNAIYEDLLQTAIELIEEFGYTAQLRRKGAPTGPPHNPQPGADTFHDCKVVEVEYSLTNRDATLVLRGDKLGLISTALDIVPAMDDVLMLADGSYRFIDLQPLQPGGQVLLYEFHCRK
jgi:hypothetical protein